MKYVKDYKYFLNRRPIQEEFVSKLVKLKIYVMNSQVYTLMWLKQGILETLIKS